MKRQVGSTNGLRAARARGVGGALGAQESTLGLIFHWADKQGLALLDLKDLRAVITHLTSPEGKADLKG
ncbi:helicase HerA-like domain-containing protein, partial [Nocardia farcinica]|uniref:helicase HerA-like domain-containing protein n=1 Tax=Nocardia farcinica TaxID=37329 RepID=UPI0024542AA8